MERVLIPLSAATTNRWSGGETHELYVYPETASYKARDFLVRLSVAHAEVEQSEYTMLPGVTRHLVSLKGNSSLTHVGKSGDRSYMLSELDNVDVFSGDEQTFADGAITDYNVMLRGGATGKTFVIRNHVHHMTTESDMIALFAYAGDTRIAYTDGSHQVIPENSLIVIRTEQLDSAEVLSGVAIVSFICLPPVAVQ